MGTITINISDEVENKFRKKVHQLYGNRKGVISNALTEAILEWSIKKEYFNRAMQLLHDGVNLGKIKYKNRDELYDRN